MESENVKPVWSAIDHNALASIVSFNLPFFQTTRTLYHLIPYYALITNPQTSCFIPYRGSRIRPPKFCHYGNG